MQEEMVSTFASLDETHNVGAKIESESFAPQIGSNTREEGEHVC